jgi:hypothetical protein
MFMNNILSRHPRMGFLAITSILIGCIALIGTKAVANIDKQSEVTRANPHHLPDDLNPRVKRTLEYLEPIANVIKGEVTESVNTLHSGAFGKRFAYVQPTFDYTTGTSN